MTADLIEFLRARLDEDEKTAQRATEYAEETWRLDEQSGDTVLWWPPEPGVAQAERAHGLPVTADQWRGQDIRVDGARIAPHIARHDPARVLDEVEAKRRLLDMYVTPESSPALSDSFNRLTANVTRTVLAEVFRHLATTYADHADYREEWRP
ncbi:DUF6221 family protein [Actinacidiphila glaucinigra]|uniref:DUF6221 family protein n=1 Tax=Actinacidiphila glaucinigra TaxID=235986 RepID=UPI0035DD1CB9